ncbi:hypothetical protein Y032_0651g1145 [Ancylostoma ceylanicum]|nr:hypothetical protein Y032_0651g1145 [Ancylostoma ceylanicum]
MEAADYRQRKSPATHKTQRGKRQDGGRTTTGGDPHTPDLANLPPGLRSPDDFYLILLELNTSYVGCSTYYKKIFRNWMRASESRTQVEFRINCPYINFEGEDTDVVPLHYCVTNKLCYYPSSPYRRTLSYRSFCRNRRLPASAEQLKHPFPATDGNSHWFKEIMNIIRNDSLTKQQRMGIIRELPVNQTSAEWVSDMKEVSKTIDLFDWFDSEQQRASEPVSSVFKKVAEMMFEGDFLSKTSAEQSEELHSLYKLGETLSPSDGLLLLNTLRKFEEKIEELGLGSASTAKTSR